MNKTQQKCDNINNYLTQIPGGDGGGGGGGGGGAYGTPETTNHPHTVNIEKVTNGFIVRIGCKTFVSTKWSEITIGLMDYFTNPVAAEKKYCGGNNNL